MKKIIPYISFALFFLALAGSVSAQKKFKITGTVDNLKDGRFFTLFTGPDFGKYKSDTIEVKNYKFEYTGSVKEPMYMFLLLDMQNIDDKIPAYGIHFFLENSNITIKADLKNLNKAVVKGSNLNDQHKKILTGTPLFKEVEKVNGKLRMAIRDGKQDSIDILELRRTELIDKTIAYLSSLPSYKNNVAIMFLIYEHLGMMMEDEKLEALIHTFNPKVQESMYAQFLLNNIYKKRALAIGQKAPDFNLKDIGGKNYSLADFKGKLLLLDFGASWCYWCKLETPYLKDAYEKYKQDGLEIVNISMDDKREAWEHDLEKEKYPWISISDLQAWNSDVAKNYNISGVPLILLIDPDGVILQNDLRGQKIGAAIREYLGIDEEVNEFSLQGKLHDSTDGQKIYLSYKGASGSVLDSVQSKNGYFFFKGEVTQPELSTLLLDNTNTGFEQFSSASDKLMFYLDNENVVLESTGTFKQAVIKGSELNDLHKEYKEFMLPPVDRMKKLNEEYLAEEEDVRTKESYIKEMDRKFSIAEKNLFDLQKEYVENHPKSLFSLLALFELSTIFDDYASIEPYFLNLDESLRNSDRGKRMADNIQKKKQTVIGSDAIEIIQPDVNGKEVKLSDFRGKYVLLDFWAAWCGPCREENPNLIVAYNNYKDKNFTILGVSLDGKNNKKQWLQAIKDDKLPWTQVSDLKGFNNEAARSYGVQAIPQNYLIGPEGKIIATNIRGEELHTTLAALIK